MMIDHGDCQALGYAGSIGVALMLGAACGMITRPKLPRRHRSQDTASTLHAVIGMLVTFAALVMGLMVSSAKANFDGLEQRLTEYAIQLEEADHLFREYGPAAAPLRQDLQLYTEAALTVFSGTVQDQQTEARLLGRIEFALRQMQPEDDFHRGLRNESLIRVDGLQQQRLVILASGRVAYSTPFYLVLGFWIFVTFFIFGLNSEPNSFVIIALLLAAMATSFALFVVFDMDTPLAGLVSVSHRPLRDALFVLRQ